MFRLIFTCVTKPQRRRRSSPRNKIAVLLIAGCLARDSVWAQEELITTPPQNLVIANYNSTSVGPYGGLEGAAYVARIDDPSAAWFNPAGLARQASPEISGSADDVTLRNLLNGQVVHSPIDVRIAGFVYSRAYQF